MRREPRGEGTDLFTTLSAVHATQQTGVGNPRDLDVNLRSGAQMLEYRSIIERIRADAPRHILDWGCGYGQISDMLSRAGLNVASFDYRPGLEPGVVPLERYPHLSVSLSPDPRLLPFDDETFDAVLSCGVLEHVEDPDASLEEIRRVLTPGGTFYVYKLPNRTSYLEAIARRTGMYYHGAYEHDRVYTPLTAMRAPDAPRLRGFRGPADEHAAADADREPRRTPGRAALGGKPRPERDPGVNLLATNVELVARVSPRSSSPPPPASSAARDGEHGQRTTQPSSA